MGRTKRKLEFISNPRDRAKTFLGRRENLIRKMVEITTLCGVDALAVVYNGPDDRDPVVWPPDLAKAAAVLKRFRDMPELVQRRRMMNQGEFLRNEIRRVQGQYERLKRKALERDLLTLMYKCIAEAKAYGTCPSLEAIEDPEVRNQFALFVQRKTNEVDFRISSSPEEVVVSQPALVPNLTTAGSLVPVSSSSNRRLEGMECYDNWRQRENTTATPSLHHMPFYGANDQLNAARQEQLGFDNFSIYGNLDQINIELMSSLSHTMPYGVNHQLPGLQEQRWGEILSNHSHHDNTSVAAMSSPPQTLASGASHQMQGPMVHQGFEHSHDGVQVNNMHDASSSSPPQLQGRMEYFNNGVQLDNMNNALTSSLSHTVASGINNQLQGPEEQRVSWTGQYLPDIPPHNEEDISAFFSIPYPNERRITDHEAYFRNMFRM